MIAICLKVIATHKNTRKEKTMTNFDRYLSDINPKMLEDIAKKRRLKNTIMDVLGGFILFLILGLGSYLVLIYGQ